MSTENISENGIDEELADLEISQTLASASEPEEYDEEEKLWHIHTSTVNKQHKDPPASYELKNYELGSKIIIETHSGSVYDGIYQKTESNGFRIKVCGVSKFPEQERFKENEEQYFYASEIKYLHIFPERDEGLFSVASPALRGISYKQFLHGRELMWNHLYLPMLDNRFQEILGDLLNRDVIGVVGLGSHVEKVRFTKLSFLVISTRKKIYLFDIKLTPQHFWNAGLRRVLEDDSIQKVVYESKVLADVLYNRYWKIKLTNVFDVLMTDYVIHRENGDSVSEKVKSFPDLVKEYLYLPESMFENSEWLQTHWLHYKRPASADIKTYTALMAAYLLPLKDTQEAILLKDLNQATQIYSEILASKSDECQISVSEDKIPEQLKEFLDHLRTKHTSEDCET